MRLIVYEHHMPCNWYQLALDLKDYKNYFRKNENNFKKAIDKASLIQYNNPYET